MPQLMFRIIEYWFQIFCHQQSNFFATDCGTLVSNMEKKKKTVSGKISHEHKLSYKLILHSRQDCMNHLFSYFLSFSLAFQRGLFLSQLHSLGIHILSSNSVLLCINFYYFFLPLHESLAIHNYFKNIIVLLHSDLFLFHFHKGYQQM